MLALRLFLLFPLIGCSQTIEPGGKKKWFTSGAGFQFSSRYETARGARTQNLHWMINGNVQAGIAGWQLPFSFSYSNRKAAFGHPFNRVGVSPKYKWLQLHAGYCSMSFSPWSLSGLTFPLAGLELSPGRWRITGFYGRLRKADLNVPFNRFGGGLKFGMKKAGKEWNVSIFHAIDRSKGKISLSAPEENLVVSLNGSVSIGKNWEFSGEAAISSLNSNTRLGRTKEQSVFSPVSGFSKNIYYAGKAATAYNGKVFSCRIQSEIISTGYSTSGTLFISNDIQKHQVSIRHNLFNDKVRLQGSFGFEQNNLRRSRIKTDTRLNLSAGLEGAISKNTGLSFQYTRYIQHSRFIFPEELPVITQSNQQYALSIRNKSGNKKYSGQTTGSLTYSVSSNARHFASSLSRQWKHLKKKKGVGFSAGIQHLNSAGTVIKSAGSGILYSLHPGRSTFSWSVHALVNQVQKSSMNWHVQHKLSYSVKFSSRPSVTGNLSLVSSSIVPSGILFSTIQGICNISASF